MGLFYNNRKIVQLAAFVVMLALLVFGCSAALTDARVSTQGFSGPIELLAQTDEDGGFTLELVSHAETPGIGRLAVDVMLGRINEAQSLGVDVVSGATVTSSAVLIGAATALSQLGYDIDSLAQPAPASGDVEIIELDCDVVVVGAGGAGLAAAVTAAQNGASVILIEKLGIPGGSTARSDGLIMASNTDIQKSNLVSDTNVGFASWLVQYSSGMGDSSQIMRLAENSAGNIDFLIESGVSFSSAVTSAADGSSPDRTHIVRDSEYQGGGLIVEALYSSAAAEGVDVICEAEAFELITDSIGVVRGVRAQRSNGSILNITAGATVLCTGGYDRNSELVAKLSDAGAPLSYSGLGNTGSGIIMASDIGANTARGGLMAELYDFYADTNGDTGLLVTPAGDRFVDESQNGFALYTAMAAEKQSYCWRIVDRSGYTAAFDAAIKGGYAFSADSIEELAELIDAPGLVSAFNRYNELCADGTDWQFGKEAQYLVPLAETGKVYAVRCEGLSYGSFGGLVVNSNGAVQGKYGTIEGLFAAGEVANSNFFYRAFPGFGSSLSQVVETGRITGAAAASYASRSVVPEVPTTEELEAQQAEEEAQNENTRN